MAWATGSPRKVLRTAAATVVGLGVIVTTLWRYPGAELVLFHAVWIALALITLRTSSDRLHVWVLVGLVGGLAIIVEVDDLRTHYEVSDTLVELLLDLPAFLALVVVARRQHRFLAAEHAAAEAEHRRNERQRSFFANASHALRTPITIARGHTEMALQSTSDPTIKADLRVVLDELDRLTRSADRNLRLSIAGELDPQRVRAIDSGELVRMTVERWKPTARRAWSAEVLGESSEIIGDDEQLTEALDALVENALLATTDGGSIVVRADAASDSIVLSVADDGRGVDGIALHLLFEPFEQGPQRSTGSAQGTGLGLAVVRAVAVAHGGEATMESVPGVGTVVRITVPRSGVRSGQLPDDQDPVLKI
ncbi:MAG: two-component system, OmpR family, sensor kinase [Ilumatobacteraceae bacterium]